MTPSYNTWNKKVVSEGSWLREVEYERRWLDTNDSHIYMCHRLLDTINTHSKIDITAKKSLKSEK